MSRLLLQQHMHQARRIQIETERNAGRSGVLRKELWRSALGLVRPVSAIAVEVHFGSVAYFKTPLSNPRDHFRWRRASSDGQDSVAEPPEPPRAPAGPDDPRGFPERALRFRKNSSRRPPWRLVFRSIRMKLPVDAIQLYMDRRRADLPSAMPHHADLIHRQAGGRFACRALATLIRCRTLVDARRNRLRGVLHEVIVRWVERDGRRTKPWSRCRTTVARLRRRHPTRSYRRG